MDDRNHQRDNPENDHERERGETQDKVGIHDRDVAAAVRAGVRVVLRVTVRLRGARPERQRDILSDLPHYGQNGEGDVEKD